MTRRMRFLALAGGPIFFLLVLLVVLPLLFRDRIAERVKVAVNQSLDARVEWHDVGLTFFRDFPNLTLGLNGLTVVGTRGFSGIPSPPSDILGWHWTCPLCCEA
jgi:hypothetical protein